MKTSFRFYCELCNARVALLATCSAAVGYLLSAPGLRSEILMIMCGVFLLASGALALNQCQDRKLDASMPRTSKRPIPSGRTTPIHALAFSILLLLIGFVFLLSTTRGRMVSALGLFALLWYNGIYTYFKRKSAFAAVPGALIGAVPPAMGWIAAGGTLQDPRILALCLFFFLWQIPHSWLFMAHYGEEYEKAGIPTVVSWISAAQLQRILSTWIVATGVSCFFLSAWGVVQHLATNVALLSISFWFAAQGMMPLIRSGAHYSSLSAFKKTNYYLLVVLLLLSADKIAAVP